MKNTDEFYIGWKDEMPFSLRRFLKKRILILLLLVVILSILLVATQRPFNNHTFTFGKTTMVSGVYYSEPYPMLIAENSDAQFESAYILLVGYGKFGADGIMADAQEVHGNLVGQSIELEGTLIEGDGKTVMELTKKSKSFIGFSKLDVVDDIPNDNTRKVAIFSGEILDPKCYFGVMKPGEGKIHKSCAIRCISGGIPPVFRRGIKENGDYSYFLMLNADGEKFGEEIQDYVGEKTIIKGEYWTVNGWDVLLCDTIITLN